MRPWEEVVEFNDKYFPGWRKTELVFLSNALAGEVGEVCDAVKHYYGGGTNSREVNAVDIAKELADVFVYLVLSAENIGFDSDAFYAVFEEKMRENVRRMEARGDNGGKRP